MIAIRWWLANLSPEENQAIICHQSIPKGHFPDLLPSTLWNCIQLGKATASRLTGSRFRCKLWSLVVISITIEHHTESKQHMRSFAGSGTSFGDTLKAPQLISSRKHHTSQIRLGHMRSFVGSGTSFGDTLKAPQLISSRKHHTSQIRLGHIAATCRFSLTAHMRMTIEHHTESKQHMWSFAGSGTSFGDTLKAPPVD